MDNKVYIITTNGKIGPFSKKDEDQWKFTDPNSGTHIIGELNQKWYYSPGYAGSGFPARAR